MRVNLPLWARQGWPGPTPGLKKVSQSGPAYIYHIMPRGNKHGMSGNFLKLNDAKKKWCYLAPMFLTLSLHTERSLKFCCHLWLCCLTLKWPKLLSRALHNWNRIKGLNLFLPQVIWKKSTPLFPQGWIIVIHCILASVGTIYRDSNLIKIAAAL